LIALQTGEAARPAAMATFPRAGGYIRARVRDHFGFLADKTCDGPGMTQGKMEFRA
jgi:hypothetical protein